MKYYDIINLYPTVFLIISNLASLIENGRTQIRGGHYWMWAWRPGRSHWHFPCRPFRDHLRTSIETRRGNHPDAPAPGATPLIAVKVGAGIQVPPNATRILHRWGLLAKVKAVCVEPADVTYRSYRDGKPLHNQRYVPSLETRYGFPYLQIHRADYHRILVEEARRLGVSIVLGAKVMGVDFERTALTIQTQPGVEVVFDLVLGADGLSSMCREAVVGHVSPPHRTGDLAYRMVIKAEDMKQESHLNKFIRNAALNFWMGPRGHLVGYSLRKEGLYNIVAICPDDLPELVNTMQCELDEVRDIFREWDPKIGEMFDLVQHTTKWRLMTGSELAAWSKGNFTLLGDACHATLPYL